MAITAGNLIKLSEAINKINGDLKNTMQNRIVWYRGNLPTNFPSDASWTNRFEKSKTLPSISLNSGVISFSKVYDTILRAFVIWSQVRKITYRYTYKHSDSSSTWYDDHSYTNIGRISQTNANISEEMKNQVNNKGQRLTASNMNTFITTLYNKWNSLLTKYPVNWRHDACHGSCHSSCHSSGGRR